MRVSVIVPLLNEIERLPELHQHLQKLNFAEAIFVDGGSDDGSWQWLQKNSHFKNIQSQPGRARQMNAGAKEALGDCLLFLHADSNLPKEVSQELGCAFAQGYKWGRFDLQFIEQDWRMKLIAFFINMRSRLTSISTGDQALFIDSQLFQQAGGYADIPLMEDVELCRRLIAYEKTAYRKPYCSKLKVTTSSRRWLTNGVLKTVLQMWWFRFAYFIGVSPTTLAARYKNIR